MRLKESLGKPRMAEQSLPRQKASTLADRALELVNTQPPSFSYLRNGESLSLDLGVFEYFRIRKLSRDTFRHYGGRTLAAFEAVYKHSEDEIRERARREGQYDEARGEVLPYFRAKMSTERRISGFVNVPIALERNVYFYPYDTENRRETPAEGPSKYFVFGIARTSSEIPRSENPIWRMKRIPGSIKRILWM